MNSKKLIIFDFDGTLVDTEFIASRVFTQVWTSLGIPMTEDYFLTNFAGTGHDAQIVVDLKIKLKPEGLAKSQSAFDLALQTDLKPVAGMELLLASLQNNFTYCVASNSETEYLHRVLKISGLQHFFADRIFSAHDVEKPKPAPDVFLLAARTLGFTPQNCIVIEDSAAGIAAGKNAEMKVIGFFAGLHCNAAVRAKVLAAAADHYCDSAAELKDTLLKEL